MMMMMMMMVTLLPFIHPTCILPVSSARSRSVHIPNPAAKNALCFSNPLKP